MNMSNGWMKKFDQILIHLFNTSYANESGYRERNETLRKTAGNGGHLIPRSLLLLATSLYPPTD